MGWNGELSKYLRDIKGIPLLTEEEEKALFKKMKKGDRSARDEIARGNLRLVISIAKKYQHMGLALDDLIEEGNLGLLKAIEKYDLRKNCRFATYASFWIRQNITRALTNEGKLIRIPAHITSRLSKMGKANKRLRQTLSREPSADEIAAEINLPPGNIRELQAVVLSHESLDSPVGEEGSGQLMDIIIDKSRDFFEVRTIERIAKIIQYDSIMHFVNNLPERESTVIKLRYGLEDGIFRTLDEVGRELNLTRERIRQIESSAIKKLRQALVAKR